MIGEKLCFAIVFAAEAMIAWLYLEYILSRKNPLPISICSFGIGYATLFAFSLLDSTTINAITFCGINYFLIKYNYQCSIKPLCFILRFCALLWLARNFLLF